MKNRLPSPSFRSALAAGLIFAALTLAAHDGKDHDQPAAKATAGVLVPVDAKTDAAWLATARAAYPLEICAVCGDEIPAAASPQVPEYVYRVAGKPDRLVRFCAHDDCVADFKKNPDKYLKLIDDAAGAKAAAAKH
jgi:hypothetical protein